MEKIKTRKNKEKLDPSRRLKISRINENSL